MLVKVTGVAFEKGGYTTEAPTVEKLPVATGTGVVEAPANSSSTTGVYEGKLDYGTAAPMPAGDILLLKYSWSANTNLPAETYTSTIKVEITETT